LNQVQLTQKLSDKEVKNETSATIGELGDVSEDLHNTTVILNELVELRKIQENVLTLCKTFWG
jgi:hypothetical protein